MTDNSMLSLSQKPGVFFDGYTLLAAYIKYYSSVSTSTLAKKNSVPNSIVKIKARTRVNGEGLIQLHSSESLEVISPLPKITENGKIVRTYSNEHLDTEKIKG